MTRAHCSFHSAVVFLCPICPKNFPLLSTDSPWDRLKVGVMRPWGMFEKLTQCVWRHLLKLPYYQGGGYPCNSDLRIKLWQKGDDEKEGKKNWTRVEDYYFSEEREREREKGIGASAWHWNRTGFGHTHSTQSLSLSPLSLSSPSFSLVAP